jgi:hypothetical protein
LKPQPKVAAGGIGGAAAVLIVWAAGELGVSMPAEVGAAVATLIGFVAAYFKT